MTFKKIKPLVIEMITFVFAVCVILVALTVGKFIEVHINAHLLTIVSIIIVFTLLISSFSRIVNLGVRALTDFAFQHTIEDVYVFLNIQPYKASVFTEKFGPNHERSIGMYYLVHLKKGQQMYTLISPLYVELVAGKTYRIKSGRSSHVFLSSNLIEKTGDGPLSSEES